MWCWRGRHRRPPRRPLRALRAWKDSQNAQQEMTSNGAPGGVSSTPRGGTGATPDIQPGVLAILLSLDRCPPHCIAMAQYTLFSSPLRPRTPCRACSMVNHKVSDLILRHGPGLTFFRRRIPRPSFVPTSAGQTRLLTTLTPHPPIPNPRRYVTL